METAFILENTDGAAWAGFGIFLYPPLCLLVVRVAVLPLAVVLVTRETGMPRCLVLVAHGKPALDALNPCIVGIVQRTVVASAAQTPTEVFMPHEFPDGQEPVVPGKCVSKMSQ